MRTVKRNVMSVNIPKSDVRQFSHLEWKGLSDSLNFITVDQQTFSDSDNVYVNEEGILASRPPICLASKYDLSDVVKISSFDKVLVAQVQIGEVYELNFIVNNDIKAAITTSQECKLIFVERKIFIFTETTFDYFDVDTYVYGNAEQFIYIPITKTISNGIESTNEQVNELTTKTVSRYLLSAESKVDFSQLIDKEIKVTIDDKVYELEYTKYIDYTFVQQLTIGDFSHISMCENGTFITYDGELVRYTVDGKLFVMIPLLTDIVGNPYISQDGSTIFAFKQDGLYAISVLITQEAELTYPTWTRIPYEETLSNAMIPFGNFVTEDIYTLIYKIDSGLFCIHIVRPDVNSGSPYYIYSDEEGFVDLAVSNVQPNLVYTNRSTDANMLCILYKDNIAAVYNKLMIIFIHPNGTVQLYRVCDLKYNTTWLTTPPIDCGLTIIMNGDDDFKILVTGKAGVDTLWEYNIRLTYTDEGKQTFDEAIDGDTVISPLSTNASTKFVISSYDKSILTNTHLYINGLTLPLLFEATPYYNTDAIINKAGNIVYTSNINGIVTIDVENEGVTNYKLFSHMSMLDKMFLSCENTLYISDTSKRTTDNKFMWYLPAISTQKFDYNITNLHPLSKTEMGIFFENEITYVTLGDYGYVYTKSKLEVGCKEGGSVITSYDGKYIIFSTSRGLAYMSYQDFVASNEQTLTYLSDTIQTRYDAFNVSAVKLLTYKYWILCYRENYKSLYLLDIRSGTWWKWSYNKPISNIIKFDNDLLILSNHNVYFVNNNYVDYYDDDDIIYWSFTSQRLHFSLIDNYKHICGMTFNFIHNDRILGSVTLSLTNYRNIIDAKDATVTEYEVDHVGTLVKRLNFFKINAFQYTLSTDEKGALHVPLRLGAILVRYEIGDKVR